MFSDFWEAKQKLLQNKELTVEDCGNLLAAIDNEDLPVEVMEKAVDAIAHFMRSHPLSEAKGTDQVKIPDPKLDLLLASRQFVTDYRSSLLDDVYYIGALRLLSLGTGKNGYDNQLRKQIRTKKTAEKSYENVALHKAQLLSIRPRFQDAMEVVRSEYGIQPKLPSDANVIRYLTPDEILADYTQKRILSRNDWDRLIRTIWLKLCNPFNDLDWQKDYGLILAALCFGLIPDNLFKQNKEEWKIIWLIARQRSTSSDLLIRNDDSEKLMGAILTIAYLNSVLRDIAQRAQQTTNEDPMYELPQVIEEWVTLATEACSKLEIDTSSFNDIAQVIDAISGSPYTPIMSNPELLIRVQNDTTIESVKKLWQRVLTERLRLGEKPLPRRVPWVYFERDVTFYRLIEKHKKINRRSFYEPAMKEMDQNYPTKKKLFNTNAHLKFSVHPDAKGFAREIIKTFEERMKK